ncbi:hypothetical protein LINPERHAP2_LOCUS31103 [Linum perenne]
MAALPAPPSLQLSTTTTTTALFSSPRSSFPIKRRQRTYAARAAADDDFNPESPSPPSPDSSSSSSDDPFESRLSSFRLKYRSGTGKKAEMRKARKGAAKAASGSSLYLPPVPLKEPTSEGLKVEFGFTPYSEKVNGRISFLGIAALLLVELATGKSMLSYHTPAIVMVQIYFVAAVSAIYMKYEKEKISVWPESSPSKE